jgi:hypothetical protein
MRIVLYTSSHGFGHSVRDAEFLRALARVAPDVDLEVRTAAPAWLFPAGVRVVRRSLDVGVIQSDSFRVEVAETVERYAAFARAEPELIESEAAELRAADVGLVLADIPSAAFAVATRAGVPGVGIANFSWDWIYEPYLRARPEHTHLLEHIRGQYDRADLLLRLPLSCDMSAFRRIEDIPLIARRGSPDRVATRRLLGLPLETPLVLLSFGGFDFDGIDVDRLATLSDYAFVSTRPTGGAIRAENVFILPRDTLSYIDLIAACDVVFAKPGYGILADCLANRVPVLYTPRGQFREDTTLCRSVERLGRAVRVPRAALRRWDLKPYLERLLCMKRPWRDIRLDGAEVAARHVLKLVA